MEKSVSNIIQWLYKNGYVYNGITDTYEKVGIGDVISETTIHDMPNWIVKTVTDLHEKHNYGLTKWEDFQLPKLQFREGLDGILKEWVASLSKTALKSQQNALRFIDQDDDDLLKPSTKTSGYLSPAAQRSATNTPWDLEEYEDLDTFRPYPPAEQAKPKYCIHEWSTYTGLNETFQYCKKCDEKK